MFLSQKDYANAEELHINRIHGCLQPFNHILMMQLNKKIRA